MDRLLVISLMLAVAVLAYNGHESRVERIDGITLVAPRDSSGFNVLTEIPEIGAEWVAVIPFGFSRKGSPEVSFNHSRQWWGERPSGIKHTIAVATENNLKVMLKPHVWVRGDGWPGEFDLASEDEWLTWEKTYSEYILMHAKLASETGVSLFCIGTEYRIAVQKRPAFWKKLIQDVKMIYSGPLTYAANWDNYHNVTFWEDLDYIGIDAYFPVSENKTPELAELRQNWKKIAGELKDFSSKHRRPILFTEYGYRSADFAADGHWKYSLDSLNINMQGQVNCYEALLQSFWDEPWMAGGFLWKWHMITPSRPGFMEKDYSPQGKPAAKIIKDYYTSP